MEEHIEHSSILSIDLEISQIRDESPLCLENQSQDSLDESELEAAKIGDENCVKQAVTLD